MPQPASNSPQSQTALRRSRHGELTFVGGRTEAWTWETPITLFQASALATQAERYQPVLAPDPKIN